MYKIAKYAFAGAGTFAFLHKARSFVLSADDIKKDMQIEKGFEEDDLSQLKLFSVTSQTELAREIAFYLKTRIGKLQVVRSGQSEKPTVHIMEDVNSKVIYLVCSFNSDQNSIQDSLNDLTTTISMMKSKFPSKVNVILPYYGKDDFSEEYLSEALKNVGADKILTVDMDSHHLKASPQIPLIDVDTDRLCASYFKSQGLKDLVIVAANNFLIEKVNKIKEKLEREGHRVEIGRLDSNESEVSYRGESLKGKDVILVDNVVDSGKPLYNISTYLDTLGANNIHMFATHGVINDETVEFIDHSPIKELVITNTLQLEVNQMSAKINQISVAKIIADTIAQSTFQKNLSNLSSETL